MSAPVGNKYGLGNPNSGRPPKYVTAESFSDKIFEYFEYCKGEFHEELREIRTVNKKSQEEKIEMVTVVVWDRHAERPTWSGLALFMGFQSRQSMADYSKKQAFSYSVKRALTVIEGIYEEALFSDSASGAIFALKNFGWVDKQVQEHTVKDYSVTLNLTGRPKEQ
jgi:hypothetical protein